MGGCGEVDELLFFSREIGRRHLYGVSRGWVLGGGVWAGCGCGEGGVWVVREEQAEELRQQINTCGWVGR